MQIEYIQYYPSIQVHTNQLHTALKYGPLDSYNSLIRIDKDLPLAYKAVTRPYLTGRQLNPYHEKKRK